MVVNSGLNIPKSEDSSGFSDLFISYRGDEKLYIQVAYLITPADEEREFGNLERLHDNYPKYVISGDLMNLSRNGIIHRNIIDFLLNP